MTDTMSNSDLLQKLNDMNAKQLELEKEIQVQKQMADAQAVQRLSTRKHASLFLSIL